MKSTLMIVVLCSVAISAHAQSVPAPIGPQGKPISIDDGVRWTAPMWQAAFRAKADTNKGVFTNPALKGGSLDSDTVLLGSVADQASVMALSGKTARSLSAHFADVMHVRDYGVLCDGKTDDAPAINALFASGQVRNKLILFPAGVCVVRSTVTPQLNNAGFVGAGRGQTLFLYTGTDTTLDILFFPEKTFAATISGFDVESATTMTAGNGVHIQKARYTTIADVSAVAYNEVTNTLWNGLWIDQPDFVILNRFRFWAQNAALAVSAQGAGTGYQYDVFATDGKLYGSRLGLEVSGIDNGMFDNIMDTSNTYNVVVDNALADAASQELYFGPHFTSDQAKIWGLWVNDKKCQFTPNYGIIDFRGAITASGNDGVHVQNWPNCSLRLDSPHISRNGNDGVHNADQSAHIAVSPSTYLENNAQWAVNAEFAFDHLESMGIALNNGLGGINTSQILPPALSPTQDARTPQFSASTLPVCNSSKQLGLSVWVLDGRKPGEAVGNGSGVPAYCSQTAKGASSYQWVSAFSGTLVAN